MKKIVILGSKNNNGKNEVSLVAEAFHSAESLDAKVVYFEDLLFERYNHDLPTTRVLHEPCFSPIYIRVDVYRTSYNTWLLYIVLTISSLRFF